MTTSADAARETARQRDGKFGTRPVAEADLASIDVHAHQDTAVVDIETVYAHIDAVSETVDAHIEDLDDLSTDIDHDLDSHRLMEPVENATSDYEDHLDPARFRRDIEAIAAQQSALMWATPGYGSDWGSPSRTSHVETRIEQILGAYASSLRDTVQHLPATT